MVEENASSGEDSEVPSISSVLSTRSVLVSRLNRELPGIASINLSITRLTGGNYLMSLISIAS